MAPIRPKFIKIQSDYRNDTILNKLSGNTGSFAFISTKIKIKADTTEAR